MDQLYLAGLTRKIFNHIKDINEKSELAEALAIELGRLNVLDLQRISASLEREINKLPSPYKEKIHPYFTEHLFGSYFKLMRMYDGGAFRKMQDDITDKKLFEDFCTMVIGEDNSHAQEPQYGAYYYLVSCFTMFVLDEPGHPIGMPFPGGFTVERREDGYYCPVRDKEKDVPFSICNFCPAKQSEMS